MIRQLPRCAFLILLVALPALAADETKKADDKDTDKKAAKSPLAPADTARAGIGAPASMGARAAAASTRRRVAPARAWVSCCRSSAIM